MVPCMSFFRKKQPAPDKPLVTREELDYLKSRMDVPDALFDQFQVDRASTAYQSAYTEPEPLVTVCVSTYNRGPLLLERSVRSILGQTYRNIELIVVGDGCSDDTVARMATISDPRCRFINLPERGRYPEEPQWRWMVAGTVPVNHALSLARGRFITHLDDDDEHEPDRIEVLLDAIRRDRADLVWHPFLYEDKHGRWRENAAVDFQYAQVTTSSVFYHAWFARIGWDINAYRLREPGDWNRFRKFRYLGAKLVRVPRPLLRHYQERRQLGK